MVEIATLYLGIFVGIVPFALAKVIHQTHKIVSRTRSFHNSYLYMIWAMVIVSPVFATLDFLYLNGVIAGTTPFYVILVTLWAAQTQLIAQIIANRISLLMHSHRRILRLKLGLAASIGVINIAVYVFWLRAYGPNATPADVALNITFEHVDKSFFLVLDLGLNILFLYLVHFRLIALGLTKYWTLFRINAGLTLISSVMDACLLGMLRLSNPYHFVQFVPVVYIVKLYIEMTNAALVAKVARRSRGGDISHGNESTFHSRQQNQRRDAYAKFNDEFSHEEIKAKDSHLGNDVKCNKDDIAGFDIELSAYHATGTIVKTVTTQVSTESARKL
ncbi:hypothetical protein QQS21_003266 [Conoideocrella luteorostrata]|uniref:Uncharacterized protein n=1 Tax=Conoideocrella luteorostrata TaxID=1105319 RepID=A0AAJ0G0M5_9HYPO|nr:hypothetical protein QQS21_003266 [Conoideocrella luteorostrata]